jgi:hypothetical protein
MESPNYEGSKTIGSIQADIPPPGVRAEHILGAILGLCLVKPWVEKIFSAEGKLPVVGEALGDVEIQ